MKNEEQKTYQLIMLVAIFLIGSCMGADDGIMAMLARGLGDPSYNPVFSHSLGESIIISIIWGFIFSFMIAVTYWLNYNDLDESSRTGGIISISWSIGYGLSSMAIYGVTRGILIGVISVVCLILLTIIIDVRIKRVVKQRQGHSSIRSS